MYCYDNPSALHHDLKDRFSESPRFSIYYSLLFSSYSFPNIILPCVCGILIYRTSVIFSFHLFTLFVLLGQIVVFTSLFYDSLLGMIIGRFLIGCGGESVTVCQAVIVLKWFRKEDMALPLSLTYSISKIGSVASQFLSPIISQVTN